MDFDQIIPIIYLIGVLILVLPSFLKSNSKLKQFLTNLSIWSIIVLILTTVAFIVLWNLRGRLGPPGMIFISYAIIYSIGRFFIQFMRLDSVWFAGLQEAHLISLLVLSICVPILALRATWTSRSN